MRLEDRVEKRAERAPLPEPTSTPLSAREPDIAAIAQRIIENVGRVIVGKEECVRLALIAMLCRGHALLEDVPGVGKTVLAKSLARSIGCDCARIQFTPDLLPTDITGYSLFNQQTCAFEYHAGPLMRQFVLADELNRATPKTQAALLEAMEEQQVTVDGVTHPLPTPFFVLATQNPIDFQGTFPLPEAQLDRFLLTIRLGYPSLADEVAILGLQQRIHPVNTLEQVVSDTELLALQAAAREVRVAMELREYIVALVNATRQRQDVALGASPRGSLALFRAAQARALLDGRDYALPDDIKALVKPVLAHRLMLATHLLGRDVTPETVLDELLAQIPAPGSPKSLGPALPWRR